MADKMVQPDKDAKPVSGETAAAFASGGQSKGADYPNANDGKDPEQGSVMGHGGQTEMGYHGPGQLGDQKVGDKHQNAGAQSKADKAS